MQGKCNTKGTSGQQQRRGGSRTCVVRGITTGYEGDSAPRIVRAECSKGIDAEEGSLEGVGRETGTISTVEGRQERQLPNFFSARDMNSPSRGAEAHKRPQHLSVYVSLFLSFNLSCMGRGVETYRRSGGKGRKSICRKLISENSDHATV